MCCTFLRFLVFFHIISFLVAAFCYFCNTAVLFCIICFLLFLSQCIPIYNSFYWRATASDSESAQKNVIQLHNRINISYEHNSKRKPLCCEQFSSFWHQKSKKRFFEAGGFWVACGGEFLLDWLDVLNQSKNSF